MDTTTSAPFAGYDPLVDGAVVDVTGGKLTQLTLIAVPSSPVGSVRFSLDSVTNFRTESIAPYALAGDGGTAQDLFPWVMTLGDHTVTATPFSAAQAGGTPGQPLTARFRLVELKLSTSVNELGFVSVINQAAPAAQSLTLTNDGNIAGRYSITNIPNWLTVSPSTGDVAPGQTLPLTLTSSACTQLLSQTAEITISAGKLAPLPIQIRRDCGSTQATYDYALRRFYFNQAVPALDTSQAAADRVRTVATRPGIARAFVVANSINAPVPSVKLFWQDLNGAVGSYNLTGPTQMRTTYDEAILAQSFNVELPPDFFVLGRKYYVMVDPDNAVPETVESNNRYPITNGEYALLNPLTAPEHRVTFIPITIGATTTRMDMARAEMLYERARALHPISSYNLAIRSQPFVYNNTADNAGWSDLLSKLNQLHTLDNSTRYYHGITDARPDTSSTGGIAYLSRKVGLSLPSGKTVAHELGHNFSLQHAACGGPANPDSNYPYTNAAVGVYGYDIFNKVVKLPTAKDFMSYCSNYWVSDWTYKKVMAYRGDASLNRGLSVTEGISLVQKALLVSGYVAEEQFHFDTVLTANILSKHSSEGDFQLVGVDAFGAELFRQGFELDKIEHADQLHFTVAVPFSGSVNLINKLQIIRTYDGTVLAEKENSYSTTVQGAQAAVPATATVIDAGIVAIQWNTQRYDSAIIRDLETGNILAIDASGLINVVSTAETFELIYSKGFAQTKEIVSLSK